MEGSTTKSGLPVETVNIMDKKSLETETNDNDTVNDTALGLIMLHKHDNTGYDNLLEKYDNSSLLPVDAACQIDCGADVTDNDNNVSHDSDDTIILQKEIEESNWENTKENQIQSTSNSHPENGLPVETNNNIKVSKSDNTDTAGLTTELSKLTVSPSNTVNTTTSPHASQTINSDMTPVSPNKGTVVFRSYKLHHRATDTNDLVTSVPPDQTTATNNTENEIQLAKMPSGNSTRPSPPNKYKIQKFEIDNVRYYSCMYCNKHFDSIHHLNNHHKRNHPPVSCDVCNKIYDTPNSLIRHSYTHLGGQFKCKKCPESFHFKSEQESHSMKHSE